MATTKTEYETRLIGKFAIGDDCWLFTGSPDSDGYGIQTQFGKLKKTHRLMYELFVGPIPEGHDVHHLCGVRLCGRPSHLATKSKDEHGLEHNQNVGKKECAKGHALTPDNVAIKTARGRPYRRCRQCIRDLALAAYYASRSSE